jgi:hypothetical protein
MQQAIKWQLVQPKTFQAILNKTEVLSATIFSVCNLSLWLIVCICKLNSHEKF